MTNTGIDFAPVIIEFTLWGDSHMQEFNEIDIIDGLQADKSMIITTVQNNYDSMLIQLG